MPAPELPGSKPKNKLTPELPPQIKSLKNKNTDAVMKELNSCPFFMTEYDDQGGENETLEALKALAYEGEPDEIATNFKNLGNDSFKARQYRDASQYYTKAIDVKCGEKDLESKLYSNRAQCNFLLKNYRRCINDCKKSLELDPTLLKSYFRMAKALIKIENFSDAQEAISFALKLDSENRDLKLLLEEANKRAEERAKALKAKEEKIETFKKSMELRGYSQVFTKEGHALHKKYKLEDPNDFESQYIFGSIIIFPTVQKFCFLHELGEMLTVKEALQVAYSSKLDYLDTPKMALDNMEVYMETLSGGLVKVGKKKTVNDVLSTKSPQVPIIDYIIKFYAVPKEKSVEFIKNWNKKEKLDERMALGDVYNYRGDI